MKGRIEKDIWYGKVQIKIDAFYEKLHFANSLGRLRQSIRPQYRIFATLTQGRTHYQKVLGMKTTIYFNINVISHLTFDNLDSCHILEHSYVFQLEVNRI